MCLAPLCSICIGNSNCRLTDDYHRGFVYVNWISCVPNHANRRKLVNHRIGLTNESNTGISLYQEYVISE